MLWLIFFLISWFYANELLFFTSFPLSSLADNLALSWSVWLGRLVLFWLRWRPSRFHSCFFSLKVLHCSKIPNSSFYFYPAVHFQNLLLCAFRYSEGRRNLAIACPFLLLHNPSQWSDSQKVKEHFLLPILSLKNDFFPTYLNTELSLL